ncbi:hypothetical protein [Streptomyces mirabilis]
MNEKDSVTELLELDLQESPADSHTSTTAAEDRFATASVRPRTWMVD